MMQIVRSKQFFLMVVMCVVIGGCGFSPLYGNKAQGKGTVTELAAIELADIKGRMGQRLKNRLEDLFNPQHRHTTKGYVLDVVIQVTNTPFGIQLDSRITRYKTVISLNYTLVDKSTGKILSTGVVERQGGYDALNSDYATYISEKDNEKRITKELAEDIKLRLTSLLVQ